MDTLFQSVNAIDLVAFIVFISLWQGYVFLVDRYHTKHSNNLVNIVHPYRRQWIYNMMLREDRLLDVRIIAGLMSTATFFTSTSILIIAGLFGALGYGERAVELMNHLPLFTDTTIDMWVIKTLAIITVFVFSFFKLTWVIRQFNYASILVASAPHVTKVSKKEEPWVEQISTIISNAARHFNASIRSYYFGLAALSWYINPYLLMISSLVVVLVIFRREFHSKTLNILMYHKD
jgi:uncharacterized membrane protein